MAGVAQNYCASRSISLVGDHPAPVHIIYKDMVVSSAKGFLE